MELSRGPIAEKMSIISIMLRFNLALYKSAIMPPVNAPINHDIAEEELTKL